MKIFAVCFLSLLLILGAAGCAANDTEPGTPSAPAASAPQEQEAPGISEEAPDISVPAEGGIVFPSIESIDFTARYVRTNGYVEDADYPGLYWISSADELNEYYEQNKGIYSLESRKTFASDMTPGFADVMEEYDDEFFGTHDIILVLLSEGSGSVRHEVTAVDLLPSPYGSVRYLIRPEIARIVPEVGTSDMAEWHIFIEISKEYGAEGVKLVDPLIS